MPVCRRHHRIALDDFATRLAGFIFISRALCWPKPRRTIIGPCRRPFSAPTCHYQYTPSFLRGSMGNAPFTAATPTPCSTASPAEARLLQISSAARLRCRPSLLRHRCLAPRPLENVLRTGDDICRREISRPTLEAAWRLTHGLRRILAGRIRARYCRALARLLSAFRDAIEAPSALMLARFD